MAIIHVPATARATGHPVRDSPPPVPVQDNPADDVGSALGRVLRVAVTGGLQALLYPGASSPQIVAVFDDDPAAPGIVARRGNTRDAEITRRLLAHELVELNGPHGRRAASGELLDLHALRVTAPGWRWLSQHAHNAPGDGLGHMDTSEPRPVGPPRWNRVCWSGVRGAP